MSGLGFVPRLMPKISSCMIDVLGQVSFVMPQYKISVRVHLCFGNEFQMCEGATATEWGVVRL